MPQHVVPKEERSAPLFNNYLVKIKEEVEDIKPVISRSSSPRFGSQIRFTPYDSDKPKRGRPKKIRVPEDQV